MASFIVEMVTSIKVALFFILCFPVFAVAQGQGDPHLANHRPLMNSVWETFNQLAYEEHIQSDGKVTYTPYFPKGLKRLDGKTVTIRGYMVPIEPIRHHRTFLLSVLPVYQCMFCGQNGIPPMVQISMAGGVKLPFMEKPIAIRGTVYLNATDDGSAEIQLREAVMLSGTQ